MKKVFNSLFVIIAAMVTFAGCAKQETDAPATSETKTVQFFANSIETKTHFGDKNDDGKYPTLWDDKDRVKVLLNLESPSGVKGLETIADIEVSEDSKSARFNAEINSEYPFNSYTFYAISPSSAYNAKSSNDGRFTVQIPNKQTPQPASVDKAAQVLYSISATTNEFQSSVQMHFKHFTAYGKLSLINLTDEISEISSVKLSFPVNVVGKWNYFVADGRIEAKEATSEIELTTTSTDGIWFACAPVDVSGKTITLTVTTDKGNLVKEITFPANCMFKAGKIAKFTVDMTGITTGGTDEPGQPGETTAYYEKVTSAPADWSGKYLLVNETAAKALSAISTTSTKYGIGADITISNDKITATNELTAYQIEISNATVTAGAYVMMFDGKYLTWTSGNSLNVANSESANTNWIITLSDGNAVIKNSNDNTRQIFWNPQSPRFACYNKDGQSAVQLYVLVDSNEGGGETPEPEPKTLVSISVADDVKTEYTVGDEFVKPVVTATYDDESTADVTATATFTGYDMDAVGTQTVTVSYTEGEETKTATYTITVEEAVAPSEPTVVTIAEFLAAPVNATVLYQLTGTITNIADESWGNFTISDGVESVYIYGLTKTPQTSNDKSFASLGLKVGDKVTLVTVRGEYNEVAQGGGKTTPAYYVSHVAAPYIKVSQDVFNVGNDATSVTFDVEANVGWGIEESEGVETVIIGESEDELVMTVKATFPSNETNEEITYVITFIPEGLDYVQTVTINQAAASQGGAGNESSIVYTFATAQSSSNTAYANVYNVTIDGIQWSVPGNQNFSGYVRIGGKNLSNVVRTIYSKGSVTGNITKIVMSTNGVSNATLKVNSITLKVFATAADAASATSTPISTITNTDTDWAKSTSKVITFEKPVSDSWSNCYYRIEFNVTNSSKNSNYGIDLQKMEFYN